MGEGFIRHYFPAVHSLRTALAVWSVVWVPFAVLDMF